MKASVTLTVAATLGAVLVAGLAVAALVVYSGVYNVAASRQHEQWVYSLLETTMQHSVQLRAKGIEPPLLDDPQRIQRGAACFHDKCVQCHGAPGVSQGDIGKSAQPVPGPLVDALQRWKPREIYWITRHGIKMSGMPAWEFRLQDSEIWDVVAFVKRLPDLTPQDYAGLTREASNQPSTWQAGGAAAQRTVCGQSLTMENPAAVSTSRIGDVERGRQALYQYACNACHTIPGVTGSSPNVGPPLQGLASRQLIAGKLANTPDNLMLWVRHPKTVKPLTAMPDLAVSEEHARDIAAYLSTLR